MHWAAICNISRSLPIDWVQKKYLAKMLKSASGAFANVLKRSLVPAVRVSAVSVRRSHGGPVESDEEFDNRLVDSSILVIM